MKGVRKAVFTCCAVLALFADSAAAQTSAPSPAIRQYNSRIQMHTAPVTLQVPDGKMEVQNAAPGGSDRDMLILDNLSKEPKVLPEGPRRRVPQEKAQQNKNWILPPSTDEKKSSDEIQLDQEEEPPASGWGWLADDVRVRQQKAKEKADAEEESDSEEEGGQAKEPSARPKKEPDKPKSDSIFLNATFKPVSGSTGKKESETTEGEGSARDEREEDRGTPANGPTTVESPPDGHSPDSRQEQTSRTDAPWANKRPPGKDSKPGSTLSQTESLLSMTKPETVKPMDGLDRRSFMPAVGGGPTPRIEAKAPESPRRDLITADGFQPLQTAPVNDLGSTRWNGSFSDRTPFSVPTAPFHESSAARAPPIEPLKPPQLELPKPVESPWLR